MSEDYYEQSVETLLVAIRAYLDHQSPQDITAEMMAAYITQTAREQIYQDLSQAHTADLRRAAHLLAEQSPGSQIIYLLLYGRVSPGR